MESDRVRYHGKFQKSHKTIYFFFAILLGFLIRIPIPASLATTHYTSHIEKELPSIPVDTNETEQTWNDEMINILIHLILKYPKTKKVFDTFSTDSLPLVLLSIHLPPPNA